MKCTHHYFIIYTLYITKLFAILSESIMSQQKSLSGNAYSARTMNGVISLSDGQGTVIEDGSIQTGNIGAGSINATTVIADNLLQADIPETITAAWEFTELPYSTVPPTSDYHFSNKLYVDDSISNAGGAFVTLATSQTISGAKVFSTVPQSTATATLGDDLVTKDFVDSAGTAFVNLVDAQTVGGIKTFSAIPKSAGVPVASDDVSNKAYVDNSVITDYVDLTTSQTITSGVKVFSDIPQCAGVPSVNADIANKAYVDNHLIGSFVDLTTNQTINGQKQFSDLKIGNEWTFDQQSNNLHIEHSGATKAIIINNTTVGGFTDMGLDGTLVVERGVRCNVAPTLSDELCNKTYVDNEVANAGVNYVDITTAQSISGKKNFQNVIEQSIGNSSVALGTNALPLFTSTQGRFTTAVGVDSCSTNVNDYTVAVGWKSCETTPANEVIGIGAKASKLNAGTQSVCVGNNSAEFNCGQGSTTIGTVSNRNSAGVQSCAMGFFAGENTGAGSVSIGAYANRNATAGAGAYSTNIGQSAAVGGSNTGDINIGFYSGAYAALNGKTAARAINIGWEAGVRSSSASADDCISIGTLAGNNNDLGARGIYSMCMGRDSMYNGGSGLSSIALGPFSAKYGIDDYALVVGHAAGEGFAFTDVYAGGNVHFNKVGNSAVCIGRNSGGRGVGNHSICLGTLSGYQGYYLDQPPPQPSGFRNVFPSNTTQINATGNAFDCLNANALYVKPIRWVGDANGDPITGFDTTLYYNSTTGEIGRAF